MKKIAFLFVFVNLLLSAQTNRFIYEVQAKSPQEASGVEVSNYYLDVNDDKTVYYNRLYFISDSLSKREDGFGFDGFKLTDFVIGNKKGDYAEVRPLGINLLSIKDNYAQSWRLEDDRKDFNGRQLQKATTQFGGRNWTAWFSSDIPLPYGPYVFHGLPGLIVELSDDAKDYDFKLIKTESFPSSQSIEFLETLSNRAAAVSVGRYKKMMIDQYRDPFAAVAQMGGDGPLRLEDGTILRKSELKPAEERERKKMLENNNPINLDQKIDFPVRDRKK